MPIVLVCPNLSKYVNDSHSAKREEKRMSDMRLQLQTANEEFLQDRCGLMLVKSAKCQETFSGEGNSVLSTNACIKRSQTWPSLAGDKPPLRGVTRSVSLNGSVAPDQGSFGQYVCCRRVVMFADHVRQCMMKFGNVKMLMLRLEKIVWEGQTAAAPECC